MAYEKKYAKHLQLTVVLTSDISQIIFLTYTSASVTQIEKIPPFYEPRHH